MGNRICRARRGTVEERFTRPQRLVRQPSNVDYKKLRKLILSQKLAPCFDGVEDSAPNSDLEECPICFFFYPSLNRSRCCAKGICTECFLQMYPSNAIRPVQCPFCKTSSYAVEYRGAKTKEEKGLEQAEEQKVLEAKLRMRFEESQNAYRVMLPTQSPSRADIQSPTESSEEQPNGLDQDVRDSDTSVNDGDTEVAESTFLNAWNERHAEFGLDLEEIMVMEAIWQSIQNPQQSSETNGMSWCRREAFGSNQSISYRTITNQDVCPSVSITGGVAVAIARLAERNILQSGIARSTQEDDHASQNHAENSVENYDTMLGTMTHGTNMHQMRLVRSQEDCEFHEERSEHDCLASCSMTEDDSLDSLSAYVPEENQCSEDGFASEDNLLTEVMDNVSSFSSVHTLSDVSCGSPTSYDQYGSQNISLLQDPLAAVRHQRVFTQPNS